MRIVPLTTRPCPDIQVSGPVAQYVGGADATDGAIGADAPATRLRLPAEAGSPAPRARGGRRGNRAPGGERFPKLDQRVLLVLRRRAEIGVWFLY